MFDVWQELIFNFLPEILDKDSHRMITTLTKKTCVFEQAD